MMHVLAAVAALVVCAGLGEAVTPPKKYVVNLDLPPIKRWTQVALDHKEVAADVHKVIKYATVVLIVLIFLQMHMYRSLCN